MTLAKGGIYFSTIYIFNNTQRFLQKLEIQKIGWPLNSKHDTTVTRVVLNIIIALLW